MNRIDTRTLLIMLASVAVGVAWGFTNLVMVGVDRGEAAFRPLVWIVFSTPGALFVGWLAARRREWATALFCCFSLYFFTFFVAARIESLLVSPEQIAASAHTFYFQTSLAIHALAGVGLAVWRARTPAAPAPAAA